MKRTAKIRSYLAEQRPDLRRKYEEIYGQSDVWLYKKSHGVHSVIFQHIRPLLSGARVLDLGCGAGRLSLMCATKAAHVDGVDFSPVAISLANLGARACRIRNVAFSVADLDEYPGGDPYDLVLLVGVLEHVKDPVATLARIRRLLRPAGTAIISCPNFENFRGHSYMTLLTLLGLPMSLADRRQVSYQDMKHWARDTGFSHAKSIGAIYGFAWADKAVKDMMARVPLAVRDANLPVAFNFEAYNGWLMSQLAINRRYLLYLQSKRVLRPVQKLVTLRPRRPVDVDKALWAKISEYLDEDIKTDPFYSDVEPFCYQGGECIYFFRRV